MPYSWRRNWTTPGPVSRRCCARISSNAALFIAMLLGAPPPSPSFWYPNRLFSSCRGLTSCAENSQRWAGGRVAQTVHLHCLPLRVSAASSRATAKGLRTMWFHHLSPPVTHPYLSRGTPWQQQLGW